MDRKENSLRKTARLAGFMFLFYIAITFIYMAIFNQATSDANGVAAKLESIAQHVPLMRLAALLSVLTFFVAVALSIALYALTRSQNPYIALMALCCRVAESIIVAFSVVWTLGLLSVATASTKEAALGSVSTQALGDFLLKQGGFSIFVSSICSAVGSTLYYYLFLRARSIPIMLAWFGIFASILLIIALPLQLFEVLPEAVNFFIWLPILVFEITFALWLLFKGVRTSDPLSK